MNRVLLLVAFICYANCIELINLCKEDVFDYQRSKNVKENIPVNSFYRLQLNKRLPKIQEFYLSNTEPPNFDDPNDYDRLKDFHMDYDMLLLDVYSETFMKNLKNEDVTSKVEDYNRLENTMKKIIAWNKGFNNNFTDWRNFYYQKMRKTGTLLKNLLKAKAELLNDFFVTPSELEQVLLSLTVDQQHVPSFGGIFLYIYYSKPVMWMTGMTLQRQSKLFFSPESNGTIHFDLVVPFNNLNYENDLKTGHCAKAIELPAFYRNKGKP